MIQRDIPAPHLPPPMARLALPLVLLFAILATGCMKTRVQIVRQAQPQYNIKQGQRMAVLPFDSPGYRPEAGEIIASALVGQLAPGGYYQMVERAQVKRLIDEQTFASSDFVNPATASRIGDILGVDLLVVGTVTAYDMEEDRTTERRTERRNTGYFDPGGYPIYEDVYVNVPVLIRRGTVSADFRLVDAESARIIASATESETYNARAQDTYNISRVPPREQVLRNLATTVAEKFFRKISPHSVTEERILFRGKSPATRQGNQFAENGLWDKAMESWQRGAAIKPNDHAPYHNMAVAQEVFGNFGEAERLYNEALARKPSNQITQSQLQNVRRIQAQNRRDTPAYDATN